MTETNNSTPVAGRALAPPDDSASAADLDAHWTAIEALLVKMGVYDPEADLERQLLEQANRLLELDRTYTDDEYQLLGAYVRWLIDYLSDEGWRTSAREIIENADGIAHATRKARSQYRREIKERLANPGPFWF